jgi:aspartyl-tRNA(Asn)/glutamyl-tRNA(Gln) amidotransferase subunit A
LRQADPPAALHELGIAGAARLIEAGALSPVDLTRALLDRIEALDGQLNAFLLITAESALAQARAAEAAIMAGARRGPLHGIPFALKDIFATAGIRTTGQSKVCAERRAGGRCRLRRETPCRRRGAARQARHA